jgi:hypothetical protein
VQHLIEEMMLLAVSAPRVIQNNNNNNKNVRLAAAYTQQQDSSIRHVCREHRADDIVLAQQQNESFSKTKCCDHDD